MIIKFVFLPTQKIYFMQEASITGLFRIIVIIMLIYYGLKIIGRFVFPMLLKRTMSKMEERFREQQGTAPTPEEEVGKTTIDTKPRTQKKSTDDSGDYIDFEEVE